MLFTLLKPKSSKRHKGRRKLTPFARLLLRTLAGIVIVAWLTLVAAYVFHPYPSKVYGLMLWPKWLPIFWPEDYLQDDSTVLWHPIEEPWLKDDNWEASKAYLAQLSTETPIKAALENAGWSTDLLYSKHYTMDHPQDWPNDTGFWEFWDSKSEVAEFIKEGSTHDIFWQDYKDESEFTPTPIFTLNRLYQAYLLELARNDPRAFKEKTIEYINWLLKGKRGAQSIVQNLAWTANIGSLIDTTTTCIRGMDIPDEVILELYKELPTISIEDLSLRRGLETEYLHTSDLLFHDVEYQETLEDWKNYDADTRSVFLHRNETLNLLSADYLKVIEMGEAGEMEAMLNHSSNVIPPDTSNRRLRNYLGTTILEMTFLFQTHLWEDTWETNIRYQLLRKELADRAGIDADIRDPLTGQAFGRNIDGLPYSVGIDGIPDTEDDIHLSTLSK